MPRKTLTQITVSPLRATRDLTVILEAKPINRDPVVAAFTELHEELLKQDVAGYDEEDQEQHAQRIEDSSRAMELSRIANFDRTAGRYAVEVCGVTVGDIEIEHLEMFI